MTHRTITAAILLSTGLHLAVLLAYVNRQQTLRVDSPAQPHGHFSVVMSPVVVEPVKPISSNPVATKPVRTMAAREIAKTKTQQLTAPEETARNTTDTISSAAGHNHQDEQLQHDVLEYLHAQFRVRFQYPLLARKRGWAGEVVIALNVNHHGLIDQIAVKKSSGYPILDDNAVQTFRAIGAVTPAIQSRINNNHHLSIPVVYKLTGG